MNNEIFFVQLYNNISLYIISLIIVTILYVPIFKRLVNSVIDPMFMALIGAVFANTIPLFLIFIHKIEETYFIHFILSELIFWVFFFIFRNNRGTKLSEVRINDFNISLSLFYIFLFLMILCNILTYIIVGVPLLMRSRLEAYSQGGGIGILEHIIDFSTFYCSVYLFYLLSNKRKLLGITTALLILLFSLLAGSKSAVFKIITGYFIYLFLFQKKVLQFNKILKYVPIILIFPLITIIVKDQSGIGDSLISLFARFVMYGDGYYYAYPYDDISRINISSPFTYLFSGFLGPMRIVKSAELEPAIGFQLAQLLYPGLTVMMGPNTRLPVLNWILFGWKGLILCGALGILLSWITSRLPHYFPYSILSTIIYGYIYTKSLSIITDPTLAFGRIFTFLVFIFVIYFILIVYNKTKFKIINN